MADTDLLTVSRGGVQYKITRGELDAYLKPSAPSLPPVDVPLGLYFGGQNKWLEQRTPLPSGVNKKTFTISLWFRRNALSTNMIMYIVEPSSQVTFNTSNVLTWYDAGTASTLVPNLVFDNKTEWYHFVMAMDTTQAIETDRLKMYINGNRITDFTTETYPALNSNSSYWSSTSGVNNFGGKDGVTTHLVAYMSEIIYVDGQALLPSDLGTTDESGEWVPAEYTGEFGSNGFYLNGVTSGTVFSDASGNGRTWQSLLTGGFNVVSTPITPTSGTLYKTQEVVNRVKLKTKRRFLKRKVKE
tara:strand:- start:150 stop:1049 length:900 start_codon:yes stop_codon:yes gene_type:complete